MGAIRYNLSIVTKKHCWNMSGAGWVFPLIHNPYGLTLEKHTDLFGMMCLIHFADNERNCSEAE